MSVMSPMAVTDHVRDDGSCHLVACDSVVGLLCPSDVTASIQLTHSRELSFWLCLQDPC